MKQYIISQKVYICCQCYIWLSRYCVFEIIYRLLCNLIYVKMHLFQMRSNYNKCLHVICSHFECLHVICSHFECIIVRFNVSPHCIVSFLHVICSHFECLILTVNVSPHCIVRFNVSPHCIVRFNVSPHCIVRFNESSVGARAFRSIEGEQGNSTYHYPHLLPATRLRWDKVYK